MGGSRERSENCQPTHYSLGTGGREANILQFCKPSMCSCSRQSESAAVKALLCSILGLWYAHYMAESLGKNGFLGGDPSRYLAHRNKHHPRERNMLLRFPTRRIDQTGPTEYDVSGVKYLTRSDQEALPYRLTKMLSWNHFGRKNVGFVYAIHHGAKVG